MIKIDMDFGKDSTIELKGCNDKLQFELFVMLEEISKVLPGGLWFAVLSEHMEELRKRYKEELEHE